MLDRAHDRVDSALDFRDFTAHGCRYFGISGIHERENFPRGELVKSCRARVRAFGDGYFGHCGKTIGRGPKDSALF